MNQLLHQIKRHEGFSGKPYLDTVGRTTIGYGRNLDARPLTEDEGARLLEQDLLRLETRLDLAVREMESYCLARRAALVNMAYNLGVRGLFGFRKMWRAIDRGDWEEAADEALDSRWAVQVKVRALDIAHMLRSGEWPEKDHLPENTP